MRFSRSVAVLLLCAVPAASAPAYAQPRPAAAPAPNAAPAPATPQGDLLARGRALFEEQKYEESIQVLSAALARPNETRENRIEVHRLLAFNYITLGRREEAESTIRGLLSLDQNYSLPKNESPRFREVFTQVREKWEAEGRPGLVIDSVAPPPVTLFHNPRAEAERGQLMTVPIRLDDPGARVKTVRVFYRTGSRGAFEEVIAERAGVGARAVVPGSAVKPPFVDYYVVAEAEDGEYLATRGDASAPLRVVVPEPGKGWVLPVVIGGSVLAVGAVFGGLALAGVFKSSPPPPNTPSRDATVSITIRE